MNQANHQQEEVEHLQYEGNDVISILTKMNNNQWNKILHQYYAQLMTKYKEWMEFLVQNEYKHHRPKQRD